MEAASRGHVPPRLPTARACAHPLSLVARVSQLEMRGLRSCALAMVQALRAATESLGANHKAAHAVLESHFRLLEEQVAGDEEHAAHAADQALAGMGEAS